MGAVVLYRVLHSLEGVPVHEAEVLALALAANRQTFVNYLHPYYNKQNQIFNILITYDKDFLKKCGLSTHNM